MDEILDSPITAERKIIYAGFWIRVGAYFIDYILTIAFTVIFSLILGVSDNASGPSFLPTIILFVTLILYYPIMESSSKQASVGKMAVGIKVGDEHGNRISFANALGRFFGKILSSLTLCIGYMMAGWDEKKQALHDKIANTYVFYA
jgi:uncharacterized RDD family membrane protein YckC